MAGGFMAEGRASDAPPLAIGRKFGGYDPEKEVSSRRADIWESEALRRMKAVWKACRHDANEVVADSYNAILKTVENLRYTVEDVENFSIVLAKFQDDTHFKIKAGLFLSALMNNGKDSHYVIRTGHLPEALHYIGMFNEKDISVDGDCGAYLGCLMTRGSIMVKGNAGSQVGFEMKDGSIEVMGDADRSVGMYMEGGRIIIHGDVVRSAGFNMKNGSIVINGDGGENVGTRMRGGEIRLEGSYQCLGYGIKGGRIYHKGELIYPGDSDG